MICDGDQDGVEQPPLPLRRQTSLMQQEDRVCESDVRHQSSDVIAANPDVRFVGGSNSGSPGFHRVNSNRGSICSRYFNSADTVTGDTKARPQGSITGLISSYLFIRSIAVFTWSSV